MKKHLLIIIVVVSMLAFGPAGPAMSAETSETESVDLEGVLMGAPYLIRVPKDWNGVLLLYAHGYSTGPVTDPDAAYLGDPAEELLLAHGYALAASGFRNAGWNVEEGIRDTQRLLHHFEEVVGYPQRVIIYGASMGTVVAMKSVERYHGLYDGAVPLCSVASGATRNADLKLDYTVAYAAAFGWDPSWGEIGDLTGGYEGLEIYQQVMADFRSNFVLLGDPGYLARFEFMRLVNDMPLGGFYEPQTSSVPVPGAMLNMMLGYYLRYELEERAGGPAAQNADHVYSLSGPDRDRLSSLGMTATEMNELLDTMNEMATVEAHRPAREYLERYADFSGRIKAPILMLHNIHDPLAIVQGTEAYYEAVAAQGRDDLLMRVYTTRAGHCNFTPEQLLAMFEAMDAWLDTGTAPGTEAFPPELEFVLNYEPDPWPQPPPY